jgi:PBP1b-binding outer membrane lipoprotein LpoB
MKALILLLLLSGCTMYSVEKVAPDGSSTVVHIKSTRSFETPNLHYAREGQDAVFDFSADSVDNNTAAYMGMIAQLMQMLAAKPVQ